MSVPGTRLMGMVTPQGSQSALEALTPPPRGKMMQNIISAPKSRSIPLNGPKAPFAKAPGDASRWAGVVQAAGSVGGPASHAWVKAALQRRRDYATNTDGPSPAAAAALLDNPTKAPEAGVPTAMGHSAASTSVPDKYNIWNSPNSGATESPGDAMVSGGSMKSGYMAKLAASRRLVASKLGPTASSNLKQFAADHVVQRKALAKATSKSSGIFSNVTEADIAELVKRFSGRDLKKPSGRGLAGGSMYGDDGDADSAAAPAFSVSSLVGGQVRSKRRAPGPESSTMRRAALCSKVAKDRGMKMIDASKYIKEHGLKW